jgi:hypothetical protein
MYGRYNKPTGMPDSNDLRTNLMIRLGNLRCIDNLDAFSTEDVRAHWRWHLDRL